MVGIEFISGITEDGLKLKGFHWKSKSKNTIIVVSHGMASSIFEDYYPEIFGEYFMKNDIGFLYGHNRGYCHVNEIESTNGDIVKYGSTYEKFEDCFYDLDLWVKKAKELGYKNIILMGHSLGCNKAIHYLSKSKSGYVNKLVLASPSDTVGITKVEISQFDYSKMLKEAQQNIKNGEPRKILSSMLWDYYDISSQTFVSLCVDGCAADNLPLLRNPDKFDALSKINIPILAFLGEFDDVKIREFEEDLDLIKSKAISCPDFTCKIVEGSGHCYQGKEKEVAKLIMNWVKKS